MPTPTEIASEKERLYESTSLRDDLNDNEATILLEWGESQVDRLARDFPDEFEEKTRFLRQLLKNINRFVGQREFNDDAGQAKYMKKVSMYLEPLGWTDVSESDLFNAVPDDKANMLANLLAIIRVLSPESDTASAPSNTDSPATSIGAHTEATPLNTDSPATSLDANDNLIMALEQSAETIVEEIIDPIFTAETFPMIDAEDVVETADTPSQVTADESENDEPYRKQFNKFLEVFSNHDEEEE
ncbi:MAG: hypothetical protein Phog2KO_18690 [Phototrophicaceae bacterium]